MAEGFAKTDTVLGICEQLSDDKDTAVAEVMTAAAVVAVIAGMNDDQAVSALRSGLKAIRSCDEKAVH